ncbi:MAG: helix-turn-helix transcriptional regulator [bacterium]|nr:helix-turn-helix transcriptional regulator [bacterium]
MLHENLKALRKAAGISQEELAIRLHVVRQTISKWEKGLSVPDAQMLIRIAEVFDVPVSELLGAGFEGRAEQSPVAEQLSRINEQLAIRNRRARRIWKVVAGVVIAIIVVNVLLMVLSIAAYSVYSDAPAITETETIADQP